MLFQLRGEVQSLLDQQADSFLESELLGRGGMGEVWRARDARLKRDVAIKVLPAGLAGEPERGRYRKAPRREW